MKRKHKLAKRLQRSRVQRERPQSAKEGPIIYVGYDDTLSRLFKISYISKSEVEELLDGGVEGVEEDCWLVSFARGEEEKHIVFRTSSAALDFCHENFNISGFSTFHDKETYKKFSF